MTPHYADPWLTVYAGDCREVLRTLPAESVHCVVTSPPFWGLRDYQVEGQLGLEPTPEQYVENMVAVFREVRRVLRNDGTLWLNLGDSYSANNSGNYGYTDGRTNRSERHAAGLVPGLKPKDLVGIPWRVAFALQADGWYLRSDIIWSKPNPMPESVTDRPTKSHEYLFLLAKSPRYFFDADAVREPADTADHHNRYHEASKGYQQWSPPGQTRQSNAAMMGVNPAGRNIRSVWTIPTQPYPGAHFAVFPPKLVEPCVKAGTSERGVCPECGAPWRRVVERTVEGERHESPKDRDAHDARPTSGAYATSRLHSQYFAITPQTTGWEPSCKHETCRWCAESPGAHDHETVTRMPVPATILDPFAGSGTVGVVAQSLSRRAVLIDLNPSYIEQQLKRNAALPLGLAG